MQIEIKYMKDRSRVKMCDWRRGGGKIFRTSSSTGLCGTWILNQVECFRLRLPYLWSLALRDERMWVGSKGWCSKTQKDRRFLLNIGLDPVWQRVAYPKREHKDVSRWIHKLLRWMHGQPYPLYSTRTGYPQQKESRNLPVRFTVWRYEW
jgi:hypothetical protein